MAQIFSQLPLLFHVEELQICTDGWNHDLDREPPQWLELFRLFTSVQSLYVCESMVPTVAAALRDLTKETAKKKT